MPISLLQTSPRGTAGAPATSVAATFSSTPTVGSWVIAVLNTGAGEFGTNPTGWTLVDNQSNTYTQRAVATASGNRLSVWTAPITTASGTFTATATMTGAGVDASQGMTLLEVTALNSGSLVDLLTQLSDQATYATSFNVTTAATTAADEIVIALAVMRDNGSFNASPSPAVPPSSYTTIFNTTTGDGGGYASYRITTATGAQSINYSGLPIDGSPGMIIVSFRGAASGTDEIFQTGDTSANLADQAYRDLAFQTGAYSSSFAEFPVDFYGNVNGELANNATFDTTQQFAYQAYYDSAVVASFLNNTSNFLLEDSLPTITGTVSYTNVNDTSTASGTTTVTGTIARTNANDTSTASGTPTVVGTLATTNQNDTSSASGTPTVTGTLARTNANDTSTASGTTTVTGTIARTNQDDTSNASGSVGAAVSGTVAVTNQNDTSSASGTTAVTGTIARTNTNDTGAATGTTTVVGTLARTNGNDTATASGGTTVTGTIARTNQNDTSTASGTTAVAGTGSATNRNDTLAAFGTVNGGGGVAQQYQNKLSIVDYKLGL